MSHGITLDPVYQKVKAQDTEIPLEDVASTSCLSEEEHSVSLPVAVPATQTCSQKCQERCQKLRQCGSRFGKCIAITLILGFIIYVAIGVGTVGYMGIVTYQCLHPRHSETTVYRFEDNEIAGLRLGVVTGSISVSTCPLADRVTLRVSTYAHSADLLATMVPDVSVANKIFSLQLQQPSFDWLHCQHARLELIIPERLSNQRKLSLSLHAVVGKISMRHVTGVFSSVEVKSDVGYQRIDDIDVETTLTINSQLGYTSVRNVVAEELQLNVNVGSFNVDRTTVTSLARTSVNVGRADLHRSDIQTLQLRGNVARVQMDGFPVTRAVDAIIKYGSLSFVPHGGWSGRFDLRSPFGFIDFRSHSQAATPALFVDHPARVQGVQPALTGEKATNLLFLASDYGSVHFLLPQPPKDQRVPL